MEFTINKADVKIDGDKITFDSESCKSLHVTGMNKIMVKDIEPGNVFVGGELEVLEHFDNGESLIMYTTPIKDVRFGDCNNWRISDLREKLNGEFLIQLDKYINLNDVVMHNTELKALCESDSYGTFKSYVSVMTFDQWRKYKELIGSVGNGEWLSTPWTLKDNTCVCCAESYGSLIPFGYFQKCNVRPIFVMKSEALVNE